MNVKIITKDIAVTDGMKEEAAERLAVIEKFIGENEQIKISVTSTKNQINISVMFLYEGKLVKVEKHGEDYYELLNELADSLKAKLQKLHTKKIKRRQDQEYALKDIEYNHEADELDSMNLIVKKKKISLESMTPEEAVEKMEELGHESFIFQNIESGKPCMIYVRNDARYGLIETN